MSSGLKWLLMIILVPSILNIAAIAFIPPIGTAEIAIVQQFDKTALNVRQQVTHKKVVTR